MCCTKSISCLHLRIRYYTTSFSPFHLECRVNLSIRDIRGDRGVNTQYSGLLLKNLQIMSPCYALWRVSLTLSSNLIQLPPKSTAPLLLSNSSLQKRTPGEEGASEVRPRTWRQAMSRTSTNHSMVKEICKLWGGTEYIYWRGIQNPPQPHLSTLAYYCLISSLDQGRTREWYLAEWRLGQIEVCRLV